MKHLRPIISVILVLTCDIFCFSTVVQVDRLQTFKQPVSPELMDNYLFSSYFTNNKTAYNLKGFEVANPGSAIRDIKINPAGFSLALLSGKPGKTKVSIHPINPKKVKMTEVAGLIAPTAMCYSSDSRKLYIADSGVIKVVDAKTLTIDKEFPIDGMPHTMTVSHNDYYIVAIKDGSVAVINASTGQLRKTIPTDGSVSIAFNNYDTQMGVLSDKGLLKLYGTDDFTVKNSFDGLGKAESLFFHPEDNYVGMVSDGNRIQFVNLFDPIDRPVVYEPEIKSARFLRDGQGNLYVTSMGKEAIRYRQIGGFAPNFGMLLNQMVEGRMRDWMKMRPGETELEYRERVNEETIRLQRQLFANEAANELALTAGLGNFGDVKLGRYNPSDGTLILSLGGLNDIYLTVPPEDMAGFGDGNNLQFSNHVFSVSANNNFELIYVEVFNPTNGKTYIFDNLDKQNLDFLLSDDGFVSLDLIMQSSREDVVLKGIKDRIMEDARKAGVLSDHTTVNVETHIESATNAEGRQIRNYHVDFTYHVDAEGSAKEDFDPGRYKVADSPAAASLLQIIKQAFANEFASYIVAGKELMVDITGAADALPINGVLAYDGSLGEFIDEPCYIDGNLSTLTVLKSDGLRTNEQLAFMRALAVQSEMEMMLPEMKMMDLKFRHNIEVSKEKGAKFRRINVSLVFVDAF